MLWAMEHSVCNSTNCWMVLETKGSIRGIRIIGRMLDESQRGRENGKQIVITITIKPSHHHTITHIIIIIISVIEQ